MWQTKLVIIQLLTVKSWHQLSCGIDVIVASNVICLIWYYRKMLRWRIVCFYLQKDSDKNKNTDIKKQLKTKTPVRNKYLIWVHCGPIVVIVSSRRTWQALPLSLYSFGSTSRRCVYFYCRSRRTHRNLLSAHHLVTTHSSIRPDGRHGRPGCRQANGISLLCPSITVPMCRAHFTFRPKLLPRSSVVSKAITLSETVFPQLSNTVRGSPTDRRFWCIKPKSRQSCL